MNGLSTNLVTHRLSVDLGGGDKKTFLLDKREASIIQQGLNNKAAQFLNIRDESYSKFGCRLTRLSKEELESMSRNFRDYYADHVHGSQMVDGVARTIFLKKTIRLFSDQREEIIYKEKGYYNRGIFIKIS